MCTEVETLNTTDIVPHPYGFLTSGIDALILVVVALIAVAEAHISHRTCHHLDDITIGEAIAGGVSVGTDIINRGRLQILHGVDVAVVAIDGCRTVVEDRGIRVFAPAEAFLLGSGT